ncbi:ATP-binding protein [Lysinibacillus sp. BW-2-10]|uniref:ATP-binding protein n=1 Tax=Lysinibacillus sp. BW-2-10 TaxID=2590030 RepID=UPI00118139E7|nr:ATP-binding protein [Lysinibacillus sp. BW-2-10]TSI02309.1 response regulator [Lysinibacillus sp. BW-2-10]
MKLNDQIKKSFSNQIVYLFGISISFFILGTILLFYIQNELNDKYIEEREQIVYERNLLIKINDLYDTTFIDMLSYSELITPQMESKLLSQEEEIEKLTTALEIPLETYKVDGVNTDMIREFSDDFFTVLLPSYLARNENGDNQQLDEFSNEQIEKFRESMLNSIMLVGKQLENNVKKLSVYTTYIQIAFIVFILIFLFVLQRIIKRIFKNIGEPLAKFAFAANEIAAGRDAVIQTYPERKDELGLLSIAFQKMVSTLQVKEQDLIAHNEELLAQQDELQAGQDQLQETLGTLLENEKKLTNHSALINGISTSLDKKEVLNSIVSNMCKITFSDSGMIALLYENSYASSGVSETGARQFISNLHSGLNQRLIETKKAFVIKREQDISEKGYHEAINYSYDLYLPILTTTSQKVEAIMVYSRFGYPYTDKEIEEYETLTKQIAISLDKIKLYERSEEARSINQDILNTVQEGIQLIDQNRNIIQVNHQLYEMFDSLGEEGVLSFSWSQWSSTLGEKIKDKQFIFNLDEAISAALRGNDEKSTFIYQLKENSHVIQVYCKKIVNEGKAAGTIIVHRDITKEFEVDQMKSEFVSTVSHELRTPLASVLGFTELLLHKELKPERKTKYLNTIYSEAKRLSALINDFLDIQRMESGKQSYEKKYIDIRPIWETVIENQQVQTLIHQIHLSVDTEQTRILGDKEKIQQIFTNVLSNAMKYSPKGGNIYVHLYENEQSLIIDVKDEGLGIPKESIPHLFEKFYRIDNTDHRQIGGTGLGLSIVAEIIKIHDGTITVDSQIGEGSTFTLTFPKFNIKKEDKQFAPDKDNSLSIHHDVVIIEDDLSLADLLFQELTSSGFQVSCFNNGQAALNHIKAAPPDALVLDIKLEENEIDGWTIMNELKQDEQLKQIPIFISSAFDEQERGYALGAQDFLVKPYSPSKLSKVIMQTLLENGKQGQIMIPKQEE